MEKRQYTCYRLSKEPVVDGNIDKDSAWDSIPAARGFFKINNNMELASRDTVFKIGFTPEYLYLAVKCREPLMSELKREVKDGDISIWQDDGVEVFISPKTAKNYHQFMISSAGARWHGIYYSPFLLAYEEKMPYLWESKAQQGKDYYTLEIRIPFQLFDSVPVDGNEWRFNIGRNILTAGERISTWTFMRSNFHSPEEFGLLVFCDKTISAKKAVELEKDNNLFFQRIITGRLKLQSLWNRDFFRYGKNSLTREKILALTKDWRRLENCVSSMSEMSVQEIGVILKDSRELLMKADNMRCKILMDKFFK